MLYSCLNPADGALHGTAAFDAPIRPWIETLDHLLLSVSCARTQVRQQLGLQAVIIAPAAAMDRQQLGSQPSGRHTTTAWETHPASTAALFTTAASAYATAGTTTSPRPPPPPGAPAAAAAAAALSFEQQLTLHPDPTHELTYALAGATAADCVLCAVDQACGLLQALSLSPVLVLVGVSRGPALSSGECTLSCSTSGFAISGELHGARSAG